MADGHDQDDAGAPLRGAKPSPRMDARGYGTMTKIFFRALLAGLAFLILLVALNRFDKRGAPAAFGETDLPRSSLEAANGAYWLLFLGEPEPAGLDIESKIPEYRELLGRLERVERLTWQIPPRTRSLGGRYWQMISDIPYPRPPERDWPAFLRDERERLTGLRSRLSVLFERYGRMIRSETVADFGYRVEWDRPYALRSFVLATARLHAALAVLDAGDGGWAPAVEDILTAFRFGERLAAAAQSAFFYELGRALVETAIEALAGLLSLPGCPPEVAESLLAGLPPPSPARFSARAALVGEFLWASERIERGDRWRQSEVALREIVRGRRGDQARLALNVLLARELGTGSYLQLRKAVFELFLMKNRTRKYFRDGLRRLLALDASPPFRWGTSGGDFPSFKGLNLWWLWNPSGKLYYEGLDPLRQRRTVGRKYLTRALYDLARISAALHLRGDGAGAYGADAPGKWPEGLGPQGVRDPFTGRPYGWDPDRGLLWSAGLDGKDDGGDPERDLVLPVTLR